MPTTLKHVVPQECVSTFVDRAGDAHGRMKPLANVVLAAGLSVLAAASASATDRHWSAENGASAPFNRPASWNPAPGSMSDVGNDKFIIDKGLDKVAAFAAGDDVEVK